MSHVAPAWRSREPSISGSTPNRSTASGSALRFPPAIRSGSVTLSMSPTCTERHISQGSTANTETTWRRCAGSAVSTSEEAFAAKGKTGMMVAAGMGICFLPEYSATHPGIQHRVVEGPAVSRDVSLVTVGGRSLSTAAQTFIAAVRSYDWRSATRRPAELYARVLLVFAHARNVLRSTIRTDICTNWVRFFLFWRQIITRQRNRQRPESRAPPAGRAAASPPTK